MAGDPPNDHGDCTAYTVQKSALNYMSVGWAGAVIIYGTGWYLGRKKERLRAAGPRPI